MNTSNSSEPAASDKQNFKVGSIVVYEQDGQAQLAEITALSTKKYKLFTMRAREADLNPSRLSVVPGKIPSSVTEKAARANFLLELRDEALQAAQEFPVEELWEFVHEGEREYQVGELTELYFGEESSKSHLTLRFAIYQDAIYFKRKKTIFVPRTSEVVEELNRAEQHRQEKELALKAAVEECILVTSDNTELSPSTRLLVEKIGYIASAPSQVDQSDLKEIKRFLDAFEEQRGKGEAQRSRLLEERAYNFMTAIGSYHRFTNLSQIRNGCPGDFSEAVYQESQELLSTFDSSLAGNTREDHTKLFTFTIDDKQTQDMDDALSLEALPEGGYRVGIHITDVSAVIQKDGKLDREAKDRATSHYFPEGNVNMFPSQISEGLCSLRPNEKRCAVSCFITFSPAHEIIDSRVCLSTILVDEKYSYDQIDELLDPPVGEIGTLYGIAMSYESQRMSNGGLKIQKRMVKVILSNKEELSKTDFSVVEYSDQTPARDLVGEMMILANTTFAEFACDNKIPFIYRSQEASDPNAQERLEGVPDGPAYDAALRGTLKRSITNTTPGQHTTLGLRYYSQVTSPIRRYADLVNQRQLAAYLRSESLPYDEPAITEVLHETAETLHRARVISRETHRFWILHHLAEKAKRKEKISAVVTRNDGPQFQVELEEVFIPASLKTKAELKRGDLVELNIVKVDPRYDYLKVGL